ncbi:MAG: Tm-1-like ATP-binding domain-containing protein [Gemmatimonadota bacterium]|nr:Tm-1-like ATP-binding domain-containing protein [Gemmatimonadota bacterium]
MSRTVVILATLDTKSEEVAYLRSEIESLGGEALVIDLGVVGEPGIDADVGRSDVAAAGGTPLAELLEAPTRGAAAPVMVSGATTILLDLIRDGRAHAVLGLGGTQGTSSCTAVMQALPYGFPKLMVSTVASGDTAPFVGIKDITMMFSVSDLLGLNPFTARILANAAAAAYGMSLRGGTVEAGEGDRPLVAMTNLGVLTDGATLALELFREAGYDVVVFHAVGSGGRAMEQLMKEGVVGAVFDYALGEIADELFDGLRSAGPERLTVAGSLGLPQVIVPGGAEHLGLFVEADTVPEEYANHRHVFHSPVIFVPRLGSEEFVRVAEEICARLQHTTGPAGMLLPLQGVSRYSVPGAPLHDPASDLAFFEALRAGIPEGVELVEIDAGAEDPEFVRSAVDRLVAMMEPADRESAGT